MPKIYKHEFVVQQDAIDENGHVNNVEYVKWMQEIAVMHSKAQGFGTEEYQRLGATWVVRSHKIDYVSPAFSGEHILAFTWVSTLGRSQSLRKFKFIRPADSKVLAAAETQWVYISAKTNRPSAIHDEVAAAFELTSPDEEP